MAAVGVGCLTCLGWVLSYTGLRQLAMIGGFSSWTADLWPLCVDLFVFVATLAAVANHWRGRSTLYAWSMAVLYSAATVAGNMAAAGADRLAEVVHATPAVTMVLAWHLLSRHFLPRSARVGATSAGLRTAAAAGSKAASTARGGRRNGHASYQPAGRDVAAVLRGLEERVSRQPTGGELAAALGVSERSGRRLLAELRGSAEVSRNGC